MKNLTLSLLALTAVFSISCSKSSFSDKPATPRCAGEGPSVTEQFDITGPDQVCAGTPESYVIKGTSAGSPGGAFPSYGYVTWSVDDTSKASIQVFGANSDSAVVTRKAPGNFNVKAFILITLCEGGSGQLPNKNVGDCVAPPSIISGGVYHIVSVLDSNYEIGVDTSSYSPLYPVNGLLQLVNNDSLTRFYYAWTLNGSSGDYAMNFYNLDYAMANISSTLRLNYYSSSAPVWKLVPTNDGYYRIEDSGGNILTIPGSSPGAGTQLQLSGTSGGLNQKWKLIPILRVSDPAPRETMTVVSNGFTGDIVLTNQTTSAQTTISNIVPGTSRTFYINTTSQYTIGVTNNSGTSTIYVSMKNYGGTRNWSFSGSSYTTGNYNAWTYGGPYVLRLSVNGL
ncbi:RICIN domain-containing protein [Niabella sp. CC-SYL272]|uniref:RICIN domain-containing protein n=1 Tax=Niabella agricola TaxID=2891571 RepID=UPI001F2F6A62|nr:RICIN domain-containing protein [Niabella agricola]MCF3111542.1 RICIN domain-containing protein [Niabella agricola]